MPTPHVALVELDESTLDDLLAAALESAEPGEVMAPLPGERGWTARQQAAFRSFHRHRSLTTATRVERTFVVLADGCPAGAVRLETTRRGVEVGLWLGRPWRGCGVGIRVMRQLAEHAGDRDLIAVTTSGNRAAVRLLRALGAELSTMGDTVHARLPGRPRNRCDGG